MVLTLLLLREDIWRRRVSEADRFLLTYSWKKKGWVGAEAMMVSMGYEALVETCKGGRVCMG
jgi:hypothetical protein